MSEIKAFFRHCPSCGRRFQIRLIHKEQVGQETIKEKLTATEAEMESGLMHGAPLITPLGEGPPIIVNIEDFEYTYKCKHCGHQWSEIREEEYAAKVE